MAELSKDSELIARAKAAEKSQAAEKAKLKEAATAAGLPEDTADQVYALIGNMRQRMQIYQKIAKTDADTLPWPVWTDKVTTESGSPAGYIEFDGTKTESVLMDPKLLEIAPDSLTTEERVQTIAMRIASVYGHELSHDIRNDKGARTNAKECGADHIVKNVKAGQPLAEALDEYTIIFPDAEEVQDQKFLLARIARLEDDLYKTIPESNIDFDNYCTPKLKKPDPKTRG